MRLRQRLLDVSFYKFGGPFCGCPCYTRALLFGLYLRASEFMKFPDRFGLSGHITFMSNPELRLHFGVFPTATKIQGDLV